MDATFAFAVEHDNRLIRSWLTGFFTMDSFERYVAERRATFQRLSCAPGETFSIVDITDMKIQAQDLVVPFAAMMADPRFRSRRVAFVVGSSLARMQLRRALGERAGHDARAFDDEASARRWVLTGQDALAA